MELGYLQKKVIELGKSQGFVTSDDVKMFYTKNIDVEMNKLVALGYFEKGEDCITFIKWRYKNDHPTPKRASWHKNNDLSI